MAEDNKEKQADEIEALSSIYGSEFEFENEEKTAFSISIKEGSKCAILQVTLLENYPTQSPPVYLLSIPWLEGSKRQNLCSKLENIYLENIGESIVYMWVECIRQFLVEETSLQKIQGNKECFSETVEDSLESLGLEENVCPHISSGDTITDRRSTFQPHLASITSEDELRQVLSKLHENKKIASATHNIYAYRYLTANGLVVQDCEDDGETHAGRRILFLFETLKIDNVVVIVSRWYGGIHLGPDRFKHISNAARNILESCGYVKDKRTVTKKKKH